MVQILSDVFRRNDLSGGAKVGWTLFLLLLPFIGALISLAKNSEGLSDRRYLAFYVDVLGFETRVDFESAQGERWIEVVPPGAQTSIALLKATDETPSGIETRLAWTVDDVDAAHAEFKEKGSAWTTRSSGKAIRSSAGAAPCSQARRPCSSCATPTGTRS